MGYLSCGLVKRTENFGFFKSNAMDQNNFTFIKKEVIIYLPLQPNSMPKIRQTKTPNKRCHSFNKHLLRSYYMHCFNTGNTAENQPGKKKIFAFELRFW